jgi:hypothetical protein
LSPREVTRQEAKPVAAAAQQGGGLLTPADAAAPCPKTQPASVAAPPGELPLLVAPALAGQPTGDTALLPGGASQPQPAAQADMGGNHESAAGAAAPVATWSDTQGASQAFHWVAERLMPQLPGAAEHADGLQHSGRLAGEPTCTVGGTQPPPQFAERVGHGGEGLAAGPEAAHHLAVGQQPAVSSPWKGPVGEETQVCA